MRERRLLKRGSFIATSILTLATKIIPKILFLDFLKQIASSLVGILIDTGICLGKRPLEVFIKIIFQRLCI